MRDTLVSRGLTFGSSPKLSFVLSSSILSLLVYNNERFEARSIAYGDEGRSFREPDIEVDEGETGYGNTPSRPSNAPNVKL